MRKKELKQRLSESSTRSRVYIRSELAVFDVKELLEKKR
jgi:hypothetical protein